MVPRAADGRDRGTGRHRPHLIAGAVADVDGEPLAVGRPVGRLAVRARTRQAADDAGSVCGGDAQESFARFSRPRRRGGGHPETRPEARRCLGAVVMRTLVCRSRLSTHRSGFPRITSMRCRARRRPSGESRGQFCGSLSLRASAAVAVHRDGTQTDAVQVPTVRRRRAGRIDAQHRRVIRTVAPGRHPIECASPTSARRSGSNSRASMRPLAT